MIQYHLYQPDNSLLDMEAKFLKKLLLLRVMIQHFNPLSQLHTFYLIQELTAQINKIESKVQRLVNSFMIKVCQKYQTTALFNTVRKLLDHP